MMKRYAQKFVWLALLSLLAAFCLSGCGTITTEEAQQYLDGNGDTSEQDYSKYDSGEVGAYDIDESQSGAEGADSSDSAEPSNNSAAAVTGQNGNGSSSASASSSAVANQPTAVSEEKQSVDTSVTNQCTIAINCATILDNMSSLAAEKKSLVPSDGVILKKTTVTFYKGETVFDVLKRVTKKNSIHMEFTDSVAYSGAYVEGIANLYEKDCGGRSGWEYSVNGWYPNYSCGSYVVSSGDAIEWNYTCVNGDLE